MYHHAIALMKHALQDKLARTVVLTWLWQCTNSYLVRFAATAQRERVHKWLEKCTKPILSALRKGNFGFSNQLVQSSWHAPWLSCCHSRLRLPRLRACIQCHHEYGASGIAYGVHAMLYERQALCPLQEFERQSPVRCRTWCGPYA